jgi:hypothetical protein
MMSQRGRSGRRNVRIVEEGHETAQVSESSDNVPIISSELEKPANEPTIGCTVDMSKSVDRTIWDMHQKGNMDIDIKQKLDRMGHPMKVSDIRKRIDAMKVKG